MSFVGTCERCGAAGVQVEAIGGPDDGLIVCIDTRTCDEMKETNLRSVKPTLSIDQPDGNVPPGTKADSGKMRWFLLLPWRALEGVMRVLEKGAKKYAPNNWKHVTPKERYLDAALRHIVALGNGETLDPETGEHHIDHALCCLLFYRGIEEEEKLK